MEGEHSHRSREKGMGEGMGRDKEMDSRAHSPEPPGGSVDHGGSNNHTQTTAKLLPLPQTPNKMHAEEEDLSSTSSSIPTGQMMLPENLEHYPESPCDDTESPGGQEGSDLMLKMSAGQSRDRKARSYAHRACCG